MPDRIGQQLGNYRLTSLLGRGGFAEVYLGEHVKLKNMRAAIKVLHTLISDEELEQFQREAQVIADLQHAHIIRILDFDVQSGVPFIVMDYAPNASLRKLHALGTVLPAETVHQYVKQIVLALQHSHDRKIVHRDIKPENMLVGRNGEILLSDFGVAILSHNTASLSVQTIVGTTPYMAPEQLQGKPCPASDQYALGIIAYEWLCGTRPFQGTAYEIAMQHLLMPPSPLRQHNPAVHPLIEQVILKTLAKAPQERFLDVTAFGNAFTQALKASRQTPPFIASPSVAPGSPGTSSAPERSVSAQVRSLPNNQPAIPSSFSIQSFPDVPSVPLASAAQEPTTKVQAPAIMPAPVANQPGLQELEQFRQRLEKNNKYTGALIILTNMDQLNQEAHLLSRYYWDNYSKERNNNLHTAHAYIRPHQVDGSTFAAAIFQELRADAYAAWITLKNPVFILAEKGIATLVDLHSNLRLSNFTETLALPANTIIHSLEQAIEVFRQRVEKQNEYTGALIILTGSNQVGQEAHLLSRYYWDNYPDDRRSSIHVEHVYVRSYQIGNYTFAAAVFQELRPDAYTVWIDIKAPVSGLAMKGEAIVIRA